MIDDPIVEEVHKTRERLVTEYGRGEGLSQLWREIELEFKDRVVRLAPNRPAAGERKIS